MQYSTQEQILLEPYEDNPWIFNPIQLAILRDAKIQIPEFRKIPDKGQVKLLLNVIIRKLKRDTKIFCSGTLFTALEKGEKIPLKKQIIGKITFEQFKKAFNSFWEPLKVRIKESLTTLEQALIKDRVFQIEYYHQYLRECQHLGENVNTYLRNSPQLSSLLKLTVVIKEHTLDTRMKPSYDLQEDKLILYERHCKGDFHQNSTLQVHNLGAIIIYTTIWTKWGSSAQTYYFFPQSHKFRRANANQVKALGNIDKWLLSFINDFGWRFDLDPIYSKCYICGSRLHFKTPTLLGNNWIRLIKPCCACAKKADLNPDLIRKSLEKLYQLKQPTQELRRALGIEEEEEKLDLLL